MALTALTAHSPLCGTASRVSGVKSRSFPVVFFFDLPMSFRDVPAYLPLAFWGIVPAEELLWLMLVQVLLKTAYEIIVLPLTIRIVAWVKKHERTDVYDNDISYSIWKLFDL